jgi:hypothetical protein
MTLRWILIALSAALAVVLFVTGRVAIGVLLGAIVAVRIALLLSLRRRRKELRARFGGRTRPCARPDLVVISRSGALRVLVASRTSARHPRCR